MKPTSISAPRFGSSLGPVMREHVILMQAMGYVYTTQEKRFLRLDRFLQGRSDPAGARLPVLIREWAKTRSGPQQVLECHLTGRALFRALSRIDPTVENIPWDRGIKREAHRRHRRPYIFSEEEIRCLLKTALSFASQQSLRPRTAYMMLVLGYCAGLRISETVRLMWVISMWTIESSRFVAPSSSNRDIYPCRGAFAQLFVHTSIYANKRADP
jgi:hypothetical protein